MGKCPCANPPGTSRFNPIKIPRPRKPECDSDCKKTIEKKSSGMNRQQWLESRYTNINRKMFQNSLYTYKYNGHLSGFISGMKDLKN